MKKLIALVVALLLFGVIGVAAVFVSASSSLPQIITVADYKPRLVSDVFARGNERIGEYKYEVRKLVTIDKVPKKMIDAFLAIEDRQFYEHGGINYMAIIRALLTNITSDKTTGASTITQQLARQLFLSPEKTYTRKIKEALLAKKLEENLTKDEILYLYLNQIFFGSGANGVAAAADIYFRKTLDQLSLAEIAVIAGLPQRPSAYSPIKNSKLAKGRQREVLNAMVAFGKITQEEADKAFNEPLTVYLEKEFNSVAPFAVETIRQMLVAKIGENKVINEGIQVYTTIDYKHQLAANEQVRAGLREVDKRQGYRGPLRKIATPEEQATFLKTVRDSLIEEIAPVRVVTPDGVVKSAEDTAKMYRKILPGDGKGPTIANLPTYAPIEKVVEAVVTRIDDDLGLTYVRMADVEALMDIADMDWARKPDPQVNSERAPKISKPSVALKVGDVIQVRIIADKFVSSRDKELTSKLTAIKKTNERYVPPNFNAFAQVALEQEPLVQGSLISFDLKSGETVALVGGYDFEKSEFNRALQAKRQTGSSFKSIVYAAALDKGYTPATPIQDAPIVYDGDNSNVEGQDTDIKKWKPHNHGEKFAGDILFRNALVRSLNIPTVKILETVGVSWVIDYARRLGIFSPLNADLSLGLGSSSMTLYEMTRTFGEFAKLGKRLSPIIVRKVTDREGNVLLEDLRLDDFFEKELKPIEAEYEEKRKTFLAAKSDEAQPTPTPAAVAPVEGEETETKTAADDPSKRKTPLIYFENPEQLMQPQTAYVMTSLLSATITDEGGTAGRARSLGRPAAGKTGTTNGYFDGWFVGYTAQLATGVWVGFDEEKSIGAGEVGGRTALPIWLEFMKSAHGDSPAQPFDVPGGIVFANIDSQTGKLASSSSRSVVNQAFVRGTEPRELSGAPSNRDDTDFYKEDMAE